MEFIAQIFTGVSPARLRAKNNISFEQVRERLDALTKDLPLSKVLIGWSEAPDLYARVKEYLLPKKIPLFLWMPIFSELGVFEDRFVLGVDRHGQPPTKSQPQNQENFIFHCPSLLENAEAALAVYDQYFSGDGFDGVFLDKIRFADALTCFCPHCQEVFKQYGFDADPLDFERLDDSPTPFGITAYQDGAYHFADEQWRNYFKARSQVILEALTKVCGFFRQKKLLIGMDVFAPFLSPFVGQDIPALSALCDFVKPMMYRTINAPAGLPYEWKALPHSRHGDGVFKELLGIRSVEPFDLDFAARDLKWLAENAHCPVYAGIEVNRSGTKVTPAYINESLSAYAQTGIKGCVLSWNLLNMPEENWKALIPFIDTEC